MSALAWPSVALVAVLLAYRLGSRLADRPGESARRMDAMQAQLDNVANRVQAAQLRGEQLKDIAARVDSLQLRVGLEP